MIWFANYLQMRHEAWPRVSLQINKKAGFFGNEFTVRTPLYAL